MTLYEVILYDPLLSLIMTFNCFGSVSLRSQLEEATGGIEMGAGGNTEDAGLDESFEVESVLSLREKVRLSVRFSFYSL